VIDFMDGTDEYFDWLSAMTPRSLALLARKPDLPLVIRRDMVMTPHASPGTLDVLADGLDLAGKAQIAYRPDARRSTLDRLARCMDTDIKTAVLRNPGVGPSGSTITYLAMSASDEVIRELAVTHRNAPKRLIELALNSDDPAMRTHVVYNPRLTVRELKWLARDKDERVAKAAKERLLSVLEASVGGEKL
jgi:hypothetical protein